MEVRNSSSASFDNSVNMIRYKVVFVGDVGVGKTSIINRLMDNKFSETYDPSIGVDFFSKTLKFRGKSLKLQIWDSAGQEKYRSLIPNYVRGSALIFIVFDVSRAETFENVSKWITFIRDIENPILILCGNKTDCLRNVSLETVLTFTKNENLPYYFEVSAKTGENMKKMVYSSIAELPFFENLKIEDVITELEQENSQQNKDTNSSQLGIGQNSSILDSSRGTMQFNRSEIIQKKNKCNC